MSSTSASSADGADGSDGARLLGLLGGKWLTAALSAAASLGLPEALADSPMTLARLSEVLECDRESLQRLVRVLCGENLLRENAAHELELTEAGALLRDDALGPLARFVGADFNWNPWSSLTSAIRTGTSAFETYHGAPLYDFLDGHAPEAALYHAAIDAFSKREARALAETFDFTTVKSVIDVGGGQGTLLIELAQRWPHLSGRLLERPIAVERARQAFSDAGLNERFEARVGDFRREAPARADVCILKHVVHNWDDETATALLRRCGDAVGPDGHLLVIEGVMLPGGQQNMTSLLDLEMLVLLGPGQERSKPEFRRLFAAAGLRLIESKPLTEGARLFVTQPRE